MTGAGKIAATLIAGVIMASAVAAGGQQPSNAAGDSRSNTGDAPASTAPRVPADMPPSPPKVSCDGDTLTISARNSTINAVLNAIRSCTGAQIDVPEDARGERLFAEFGPGPIRPVLADFLSSTDFNYVIKASPADPQKIQMVLLNPRPGDSAIEVATVADKSTNLTANRRGWLKARENYMKSFTAARDDSDQQADTASSAPVEATIPASDPAAAEAMAPAASPAPVEPVSSAQGPVAAPAASPAPAGANSPVASSVSPSAEPANPGTAASPDSPAPESVPVPTAEADPIASASAGSDTAPAQDKKTDQMISNMQRMFEQRKQMMQQQQSSAPQP